MNPSFALFPKEEEQTRSRNQEKHCNKGSRRTDQFLQRPFRPDAKV